MASYILEDGGSRLPFLVSALPVLRLLAVLPNSSPAASTATAIATALLHFCAAALILVGNKSDMSSKQREVSMMEGIRFARKYGLNFVEVG